MTGCELAALSCVVAGALPSVAVIIIGLVLVVRLSLEPPSKGR